MSYRPRRRPQRLPIPDRRAQRTHLAGPMDRRQFVRATGGLVAAATLGGACREINEPGSGIVRVTITGLGPEITSAGSAVISGATLPSPITLQLPAAAEGEQSVAVGTYHVVYSPPAGYTIAPGQSNEADVTIVENQTTTVTFTVVAASATIAFAITGLGSEVADGGSASVLRTDIAGQTATTVPIPASGSTTATVLPGTYQVTYTPPAGYAVSGGSNQADVTVADGATGNVAFTVALELGTLAVTVTGLQPGAPDGGTAQVVRTDVTGTPFNLDIPLAGSASTDVEPGTYEVTYVAPAGHQLQAGQTNPASATVTANATATVTYVVEAAVPATALFNSDWSTAQGTGDAALRDTGKALPWDLIVGNGTTTTVISAAGLDFPSANCLQVNGDYSGPGVQPIQTRQCAILPSNNRWPIPAVGQSVFFRLYKRLVYPVPQYPALGNNNHCIEEQGGSASNWSWSFIVDANGWRPVMQSQVSNRYRLGLNSSPVYLARNTTYRLEWQVHRIGASTCNIHVRIFQGSSTTVLYDDDDFFNDPNQAVSLANNPTLNLTNADTLDGFQVGTNGPGVDPGQNVVPMWYLGCCAVRGDDWCGPYSAGV